MDRIYFQRVTPSMAVLLISVWLVNAARGQPTPEIQGVRLRRLRGRSARWGEGPARRPFRKPGRPVAYRDDHTGHAPSLMSAGSSGALDLNGRHRPGDSLSIIRHSGSSDGYWGRCQPLASKSLMSAFASSNEISLAS